MFAATPRRHLLFYLGLPLVVAIVLLLVAKLVALQRADIIAELTDRVAHRDSSEAIAALRQLAAMPRPPVAVLVAAATSGDAEVAEEARRAIGRLLRHAERQIEAERRVRSVARQLAALAESLAAQQDAFSVGDHSWLSNTTDKLLRLANRIPPRHTPLVAMHCDAVLAAIAANKVSPTEIVDNDPVVDEPFDSEGAMIDDGGRSQQALLDQAVAGGSEVVASEHTQVSVVRGAHDPARQSSGESATDPAAEFLNSPWRASWSHPLFRMLPARPIGTPPPEEAASATAPVSPVPVGAASGAARDGDSSPPRLGEPTPAPVDEPSPPDSPAIAPPLAEVDSRELLRRWLDAEGSDAHPLEVELTHRGFGRLPERLVQQLFAPSAEDRFRLLDDVLTQPGVDPRPWLMLLCEDTDADVRLLAVTIMATSNDAALVEQAWQVSIRDRDPRIAGLAERLRARREGGRSTRR